uniref:Uncharacterized protein n=1 Tax=Medicago truncatula TaxID=3880 RepID=Q2HWB6_MEDTR|nr:hypothetical protein MtrDRAFT_AC147482g15v2 [Medicago truncatula]
MLVVTCSVPVDLGGVCKVGAKQWLFWSLISVIWWHIRT